MVTAGEPAAPILRRPRDLDTPLGRPRAATARSVASVAARERHERRPPRVVAPGRRVRRYRRREEAEEERRRRRARRQARLPHLPAAALPGRDRPARAAGRRAPDPRPLRQAGQRPRPPGPRDRRSTWQPREVAFAELEPVAYDYLVLALGARTSTSSARGAAEHAFPLYTLPDAVRLKDTSSSGGRPPTGAPELIDDGALNVVVVGGGPTGSRAAGAMAELYDGVFSRRTIPARARIRRGSPRQGLARGLLDVQARHPGLHARRR